MADERSSSPLIDIEPAAAIRGWMLRSELRWLAKHAATSVTVLEVGCFRGRSTRVLADHCRGTVHAVDPWNGEYFNDDDTRARWIDTNVFAEFSRNLAAHLESGRVIPVKGDSREVLPRLAHAVGRSFDFIFLDGDHRHSAVADDIRNALTCLRPGGVLAGHDFDHPTWPGVRRAVEDAFPGVAIERCASIWAVRV